MRTFKAICNKAIKLGYIEKRKNPFEKFELAKYNIETQKRALNKNELTRFVNFNIENYPHLLDAYYFFLFSFYCRGMNFIDVMNLKWENITKDRINYRRAKTGGLFSIEILNPVERILKHYKKTIDSIYVFPFRFSDKLTPLQAEHCKQRNLKKVNKQLKEISEILGIEKNITTYVARHSYANFLKQSSSSIELISQSMGHKSVDVTKTYLEDFNHKIIDKENKKLLEL